MPLEGLQLGNYRLLHLIGSGGMGEVYLAEDTRIHRQVAIKVIRTEASPYPDANATREAARLFQREMRAITRLDHPHILPLYDFGEETVNKAALTYMVMPYRTEGSLADWLQQRSRSELLSPQIVAHFIDQAGDALQHAHDHQLIHQDVKPSNFLIRSRATHPNYPDLLLADFGIAKFMTATATTSQSVRGTPAFMAPEQWEGHPVAATDQYALAVMTYLLLTGHPPFQGGPGQVMHQHFMAQPQPASTLNPRISPALDAVILRALAKQPEDRFPSIMAFAQAFQQALHRGDLRATLAISEPEALSGTSRILTLPGGQQVTVTVPAGAQDGQVIRLEGQGEPYYDGGQRGALILSIAITPSEETTPTPEASSDQTIMSTDSKSNSGSTEGVASSSDSKSEEHVDSNDHNSDSNIEATAPAKPFSSDTKASTPTPEPLSATEAASSPSTSPDVPSISSSAPPVVPSKPGISRSNKPLIIGLTFVLVLLFGSIGEVIYRANTIDRATATDAINSTIAQMNARNIAQLDPALAASNPDPYPPTNGKLTLYDPMHDNTNQGFGWQEGNVCMFTGTAYQVEGACSANNLELNNFAFEITVDFTQSSGQGASVFFRDVPSPDTFHAFTINNNGTYDFDVGAKTLLGGDVSPISLFGIQSDAIHQGAQTNTIAIVAIGSTIDLYANDVKINSFEDSSSNYGGLFLANTSSPVNFSNAKLWTF